MFKRFFMAILILPFLVGLAACGSDSDDDESSSSETTEAASGDEAECTTEGATDAGSDSSIDAALGEWYVTIEPTEVPAGVVSMVADNQSEIEQVHELVVVEADGIDSLEVDGNTVSEDALGDTVVGEIAEFAAGQTCEANFELAAGNYVLFCNLPDHFEEGMAAELTVAS